MSKSRLSSMVLTKGFVIEPRSLVFGFSREENIPFVMWNNGHFVIGALGDSLTFRKNIREWEKYWSDGWDGLYGSHAYIVSGFSITDDFGAFIKNFERGL